MGAQPKARSAEAASSGGNYAQNLLSRFNLPSAREGLAAPAGDFYGLLSAAVGSISTASGVSREVQAQDLTRSGSLIPEGMTSTSEKMNFLSTQREKLSILLSALDKEAGNLGNEAAIERDVEKRIAGEQLGEGLKKSKSEAEFEEIGQDDLKSAKVGKQADKGSWLWGWGSKAGVEAGKDGVGKTSGVDLGT